MEEVKLSKKELKHHSRRLSIKEGIFWTVRDAFGGRYAIPFAIALQISNPLIAIITSITYFYSVIQPWGGKLLEKFTRKKILTKSILFESLSWLFLAAIGILYLNNIGNNFLPYLIILDIILITGFHGISHPAWFSLMGDLVDSKYRGRWWAKRTTIMSFSLVILTIGLSFLLEHLKKNGLETTGFIIFFIIAFAARFASIKPITNQYEPKLKTKKKDGDYTFKIFLKNLKKTNFGNFTLFRFFFSIVIGITTPLAAIYFLRELNFTYIVYMLITMSGTFFSIITLNLWGKISDKIGNARVLAITVMIIQFNPILWILSTSKIYLILIPGLIGGATWAAFLMVSGNFIYDNIKNEHRAKAVSYYSLLMGIGAITGGLLSALFLEIIPGTTIFGISFTTITLMFVIGTVLRMIVVLIFIPNLKEIKHKKPIKGFRGFNHFLLGGIKPTLTEDIREISAIPRYMKEK